MDNRSEVREFLASRRAKITPEQAGLPVYGDNRRVPGLRREEVAMLAGVSAEYYARLERGNLGGVSESVLEALARTLQLDEAEHAHLFDLARTANATPRTRRRPTRQQVRPGVQRLLDSMTDAAAYVRNGRLDIVASNRLGRALYAPVFDDPVRPVNPVVGDLTLPFEAMPLPADPGLTLTAFSAEPGTPAHDAFSLLASWAATSGRTEPAHHQDHAPTSDGRPQNG
ncbi:hypothetical protein GCM10023195_51500 [Actinoallomurus liliacearum]|uniref:HTH cro/C1-type domain-containing protein n=1 Tax=Actinoallomurus liliacearum TaxID=1080073 RepID=A0ABP8TMM7_9ACTN